MLNDLVCDALLRQQHQVWIGAIQLDQPPYLGNVLQITVEWQAVVRIVLVHVEIELARCARCNIYGWRKIGLHQMVQTGFQLWLLQRVVPVSDVLILLVFLGCVLVGDGDVFGGLVLTDSCACNLLLLHLLLHLAVLL